jgi:signal transduction histidine kinase
MQFTAGSLNDQVSQVLNFYSSQAASQDIEIVQYLEADLPSIKMDPHTLQAALVNLVKNAIEAMPDGGQLVARTRITRSGVALDLIDTGCGMEGEALLRMFEEFYTSKDTGTGLGLPTAKKIIEGHGGRINVQSQIGQGTQFTLEFPTPKRINKQQ